MLIVILVFNKVIRYHLCQVDLCTRNRVEIFAQKMLYIATLFLRISS